MESGFLDSVTGNPYFSAGFGLIGVGAGLAVLRQGMQRGFDLARRNLLVTLEIPSRDKSYPWFLNWISHANVTRRNSQQLAVETSFRQHTNGSITSTFNLVPGPGKHYFKFKGVWLQVERQRDGRLMDLSTGNPFETVTLTTLSRDRSIFQTLLKDAREAALAKETGKTVMYTSWGSEWRPFGLPRKRRLLESVILDRGIAESIMQDVEDFISNEAWYNKRGIPYRRGYLLYGPPGSGKTSFIQALAGHLQYNICILNLSERGLTDDRLNHLLSVAPERSLMLLEDVDAAFAKRKQSDQEGFQSMVTFSGLLNALDGVASSEERIILMTTNHIELLDQALIRPGRVDMKVYLGDATPHQIRRMFLRFYEGKTDLADDFVAALEGKPPVSTAQLQGHFVTYKADPWAAVKCVSQLFHNSLGSPAQPVTHA
ncbi:BCS1 N terminal-domain-containing protein [Dimargaris cristalligena]|uniref:BCS1 N terminal-domain-containing protein n=1 Tax=Dimargaris cristalligena TaxID=215637 RepID=A0A4P9ZWW8_9FUNG|nr:BCS1 N terminal-domain-containing protein [Dimargaris cristalligena]|eukprot:RKP38154.1 BCS1 N terminal-domain-containing protein [Dimargaris cristalligena]